MAEKIKALSLFSGGLDSLLAVKLLEAQGIEVEALCFESNFYDAKKARLVAKDMGINLHCLDARKEMLALVKNPPNGYGKNMNPCIDCHGMMFRRAARFAEENGFAIVASGEVLGQRPFSQTKDALVRVAKLAGIDILRPLSARLLPETSYEQEGLVKRGRLGRISGRGREEQLGLARKYKLKEVPAPAGGCLLTDRGYSGRLAKMFDYWPDCRADDVALLRQGRIFWFEKSRKKILLSLGRREEENDNLERLARKGDIMLQLKEIGGPLGLLRGISQASPASLDLSVPKILLPEHFAAKNEKEILFNAALICSYYATKARGKRCRVNVRII